MNRMTKISKPACEQLNRKLHCDQQQQEQQNKRKTKTIVVPQQNHEYFDLKYFKRYSKVKKKQAIVQSLEEIYSFW